MNVKKLVNKIRWIFYRAARISPKRIWQYAGQSQRLTPRVPRVFIVIDMLWCILKYDATFENYDQWDWRTMSARQRASYMTDPKAARLSRLKNSQLKRVIFDNKINFANEFSDFIGREWIDLSAASEADFERFISGRDKIIAKDPTGVGGKGIELVELDGEVSSSDLYKRLVDDNLILVEEFLQQHPDMSSLYPGSVNTLRIITYRDQADKVHVLTRALKIGNGGFIDNHSNGGMYTMLDEQGVVLHAASDEDGHFFEVHPATGITLTGFQVPCFDQVLELAEKLARQVPEMPFIGWDIAITPQGPIVIEGNHNTGIFQSRATMLAEPVGLKELFETAMDDQ